MTNQNRHLHPSYVIFLVNVNRRSAVNNRVPLAPEVIVNATNNPSAANKLPTAEDFRSDEVILPKACLGRRLIKKGITNNKIFIGMPFGNHNSSEAIREAAEAIPRAFALSRG